jgi:hypothetical protein
LGLTAEDLHLIDRRFADYLHRGQGFARYRNWDKAVEELQQAVVLKPLHIEALYSLAEVLRGRFLEQGNPQDKTNALLYAERCLQADARNEGALYIISQLQVAKPRQNAWTRYRRLIRILLAILILISGVFLGWWAWNYFVNSQSNAPITVKINRFLYGTQLDLPIEIEKSTQSTGLQLSIENSFLRKTGETYIYQFRGCILSTIYELNRLKMRLELLDQAGKIRYSEQLDLLDDNAFEVRKGDAIPVARLIQDKNVTDAVFKARLVIEDIDKANPPPAYDDVLLLPVSWQTPKSADLQIAIRQRSQTIHPEPELFSHEIILEFENKGKKSVKKLQTELQWLDSKGRLVYNAVVELVNPTEPVLTAKQRRSKTYRFTIPIKQADYREYTLIGLILE